MSEHKCSDHPDAPHGFSRNASHEAGRYVCECEGWEAERKLSHAPAQSEPAPDLRATFHQRMEPFIGGFTAYSDGTYKYNNDCDEVAWLAFQAGYQLAKEVRG